MNSLRFRQMSVAHQIGLDRNLDVLEILNLSLVDENVVATYIDSSGLESTLQEKRISFVERMEKNNQAIHINCEFKKEMQQYVLISRKMGESLGVKCIKDFTKVSMCQPTFNYRNSVVLANSIKFKPLVEQKAITQSWDVYQYVLNIEALRQKTFHTRYSEKYDPHRKTINDLETQFMSAYKTINFDLLQKSMERIEIIDRILPFQFIESSKRIYLEIIKNWILVNADLPQNLHDTERTIRYINYFQLAPLVLKCDASWRNIKNALDYFLPSKY